MRKVIFSALIVELAILSGTAQAAASRSHLRALNSKYPYGLIGDDFGILSESDMEANTCSVEVTPFPPPDVHPYPYWQCFQTRHVRFRCDQIGNDDNADTEPQAFLLVDIHDDLGQQEYISRRYMTLADCVDYRKEWRRLTSNQRHVCLSGEYIFDNLERGENVRSWIYHKYKTKAGCDSYGDECDTGKVIRNECASASSG